MSVMLTQAQKRRGWYVDAAGCAMRPLGLSWLSWFDWGVYGAVDSGEIKGLDVRAFAGRLRVRAGLFLRPPSWPQGKMVRWERVNCEDESGRWLALSLRVDVFAVTVRIFQDAGGGAHES